MKSTQFELRTALLETLLILRKLESILLEMYSA